MRTGTSCWEIIKKKKPGRRLKLIIIDDQVEHDSLLLLIIREPHTSRFKASGSYNRNFISLYKGSLDKIVIVCRDSPLYVGSYKISF